MSGSTVAQIVAVLQAEKKIIAATADPPIKDIPEDVCEWLKHWYTQADAQKKDAQKKDAQKAAKQTATVQRSRNLTTRASNPRSTCSSNNQSTSTALPSIAASFIRYTNLKDDAKEEESLNFETEAFPLVPDKKKSENDCYNYLFFVAALLARGSNNFAHDVHEFPTLGGSKPDGFFASSRNILKDFMSIATILEFKNPTHNLNESADMLQCWTFGRQFLTLSGLKQVVILLITVYKLKVFTCFYDYASGEVTMEHSPVYDLSDANMTGFKIWRHYACAPPENWFQWNVVPTTIENIRVIVCDVKKNSKSSIFSGTIAGKEYAFKRACSGSYFPDLLNELVVLEKLNEAIKGDVADSIVKGKNLAQFPLLILQLTPVGELGDLRRCKALENDQATLLVEFPLLHNAVKAINNMGYVHRDIRPSNIIVTRTRFGLKLVLIDFGLALLGNKINEAFVW